MKLEEAIEHLNESLNDPNRDWGCEECKQEHEQLREWLIELKERRAADVKPVRWTPVDEQLPETDKPVLVVRGNGDMAVAVWNAALGWLHYWSGSRVKNVTHWMPLPESPKQEER